MKISVRYLILAVLVLIIFTALFFSLSAQLIYSLEQDIFISRYHDNTDVLKLQQLNSTTDLLPLMQDLMDYTGPIVLNINLRDMDQVRRDLALFAKYRKNLDNLIIRLDMSESEINEFSKNTDLQRALLEELMKASISLDELKQLEIQYRSENNQNMLISVILQQAAIRQKLKELFGQYETATDKIEAISKKYNLDTTNVEESRTEFKKIVEENTKTAPIIGSQTLQVPTLSLLLKPDTGKYQDVIELSAFYSSNAIQKTSHPITILIDNNPIIQSSTDAGGIYHSSYVIEKIPAGTHQINATSGSTASEPRTLNIIEVNSTTTLTVKAVSNKPEVQCSGVITANKPVKNAPVDIISDARSIISTTTNNAGQFQSRITLSPGTHRLEARFDNASYPISSSRSPVYEIVVASTIDAPGGKVQSVKQITVVRNADALRLTITPNNVTYKDIINISGTLSGRDPKFRNVDVFIDDALDRTIQTRQDGSYAESYVIEKIQPGLHTIFTRYREPGVEEIYSESRQFTVQPVDSITLLEIEMIDAGTGLICRGNLTAQGRGVSSAPLELVWDDRNIIKLQTDATGSFRQQVTLPVGNHNIYANFTSRDYPVKASRSKTSPVTILPPFDLYVRPSTVHFMEQLSIGGSFRGVNTSGREVQIFINGKKLGLYRTDASGNYSTQFPVEKIPAGTHRVYASSGDHTSETESFTVLLVNSTITLSARLTTDNTEVICSGQLRAGDNTPVRLAPVTLVRDGNNQIRTTTDDQGRFEETLSLPAGRHQLIAEFDNTDLYPIQPSKSVPVNIEILNPIIIRVQPDRGMYRDTLTISGVIHGTEVSGRVLQMYIDSKETGTFRSDSRGNFTAPYTIEQLRGGVHTIYVRSGDIRSDSINFTVALVQSTTTLSAVRTGETSRVTCSGTVTANNKPVRFAPVVLVWDDKNFVRTTTDMNGNYNETIVLPAGKHSIKAQFNSPDTFPINPSESAPVDVEIPLPLLILIEPNQGRYMDVLSIKGSLHTDEIAQQEIQITIDGKLTGSARTDNNGRFTIPYTLEKITGGTHTVYARYKEVSSDKGTFTVLLSDSTTILSATRVKETSRVSCIGTVTANNKPVRLAPVVLVWDEKNIVRTTTDENGKYNETIVLPAGKHRIKAQFNSPDMLPINPSESAVVLIEIPQIITIGNLVLEVMPKEGRFMDHITIRGILSNNKQNQNVVSTNANSQSTEGTQTILGNVITGKNGGTSLDITSILTVNKKPQVETRPETSQVQEISGKSVSISIDGKLQGTYPTNNKGEFFTEFIIEEIRAGLHTVYACQLKSNRHLKPSGC